MVLQVRKKRTNAEVSGTVAKQAEAAAPRAASEAARVSDPQPVKKKKTKLREGRVAQRRLQRFQNMYD